MATFSEYTKPTVNDSVNEWIVEAQKMNVSDIHIVPMRECVKVAYRLNGFLHQHTTYDRSLHDAYLRSICVRASIPIDSQFIPQDGRFDFNYGDNLPALDIRVVVVPTYFGLSCTMRLIHGNQFAENLETLGFAASDAMQIRNVLTKEKGLCIVSGSTGSGKSTTMHVLLNELRTEKHSVLAVEDPIEHVVDGVRQIQVRPEQGMTFEKALRGALRQDPDILVIGEIRDAETADIALRSALTGHIVITSLHTKNAIQCFERLLSFGLPVHTIVSALSVVIHQELNPTLCHHCRYFSVHEGYLISKQGCSYCHNGIAGRALNYELMICSNLGAQVSESSIGHLQSIPRHILESCIVKSRNTYAPTK